MRYCADTWFLLQLFDRQERALKIVENVKYGKDSLVIPSVCVVEIYRELGKRGISQKNIDAYIDNLEVSRKIEFLPIDRNIAREAARISNSYSLPLVDAIIASTAKLLCCVVLSADGHIRLLQKKYVDVESW